jgi:hydroxymethylpyrimidine pyrophosphatase-like HAD family hydrolase
MSPGQPSAGPIRLLVSDIDGTLVRDDKSLPEANREAILALAAAGVATTLISARPPSGMLGLAATLRMTGPLAAFNGGTLFDGDGTIRFAHRLERADAAAMLRLVDRPGVTLWVYADGAWFVANLDNPHLPRERLASAIEPEIRTDFTARGGRIDKIVGVSDDHALLRQLEERAREMIGARATIARSQPYYLDITHRLEKADAATMLRLVDRPGVTPWVYADGAWFAANLHNPHLPRERLASAIEPRIRTDFAGLDGRIDKIVGVSDDHELLRRLEARAKELIGDRATIARSQPYYLDITHHLANKGDGIAALARAFGVELNEVAAFGDMPNDIPMFARAGLSVALGQAPGCVRAAASAIAATNGQDGVADAILRFIRPRISH